MMAAASRRRRGLRPVTENERRQFHARLRAKVPAVFALADRLETISTEYPRVNSSKIQRLLNRARPVELLLAIAEREAAARRAAVYQTIPDEWLVMADAEEVEAFRRARALAQKQLTKARPLPDLVMAAHLGPTLRPRIDLQRLVYPGAAVTPAPTAPSLPPGELAHKRTEAIATAAKDWKRWPWLGDLAVELVDYLTPRVPRPRRARTHTQSTQPYNQTALRLTAEILTAAYAVECPGLRLTARDVKARLQARRQSRSA